MSHWTCAQFSPVTFTQYAHLRRPHAGLPLQVSIHSEKGLAIRGGIRGIQPPGVHDI
jgi:hypothetical protein